MFASTYFLGTYSGTAFTILSSETSPLTAANAAAMIKFTTGHPATTRPCLKAIEVASVPIRRVLCVYYINSAWLAVLFDIYLFDYASV